MLYGTITKMLNERMVVDVYVNDELVQTVTQGLVKIEKVPIGARIKFVKRGGLFSSREVLQEFIVEKSDCTITYTEDDEYFRLCD